MWTAGAVLGCALSLLNRSAASLPQIEFVDRRPPFVSPNADGYVLPGDERIYLITSTATFRTAQRAIYPCGALQAIRKIASVVIHEEWHVRRGDDEIGAYQAQLTALAFLGAGAGSALYADVHRSMQAVGRGTAPVSRPLRPAPRPTRR